MKESEKKEKKPKRKLSEIFLDEMREQSATDGALALVGLKRNKETKEEEKK